MLTILGAGYLATGIMIFCRTYFICVRMIENKSPTNLITQYRILHLIAFVIGILVLTLPVARVAFSNKARKSFCIGYVNSITGVK
jgi:uncharacterized membrane protein